MTHADWIYFAKFIIATLAIFYLKCLVLGILSSWFVESGACQALEEAQKVAADHLLYSLGPHTHRIRRRLLNSTFKLTLPSFFAANSPRRFPTFLETGVTL